MVETPAFGLVSTQNRCNRRALPTNFVSTSYNDDRWSEPRAAESAAHRAVSGQDDDIDERDARDVEELLRRPGEREERDYECHDTTPINYQKGPHDEEFGVDEQEFDAPDMDPVPYDQGPHDDLFDIDEDEFEELDDQDEFED
jgi:hypothetical protein